MSEISGFVQRVTTVPWNGKTLHGFALANDDRLFGTGLDKSEVVEEGAHIRFTANRNQKGRWVVETSSIEKLGNAQAAPKTNGAAKSKDAYWETKDRVIELQSCRNSAIAWIQTLAANGILQIPKAVKDRFDWANDLLDMTVERFVKENAVARDPSLAEQEEFMVPPKQEETPAEAGEEDWDNV